VATEFYMQAVALKWGVNRLDKAVREFFDTALRWVGLPTGDSVFEIALEDLLVGGAGEVGASSKQPTTVARSRGPKPDREGDRRVASLLPSNWESDLETACQLLDKPSDGGPAVKPSKAWQKEHDVNSYARAYSEIPDRLIKQHIKRRRELGMKQENSR
jgi:hypothetical protein